MLYLNITDVFKVNSNEMEHNIYSNFRMDKKLEDFMEIIKKVESKDISKLIEQQQLKKRMNEINLIYNRKRKGEENALIREDTIPKKIQKNKRFISPIQEHIKKWDSGYAVTFMIFKSDIGQKYRQKCSKYSLESCNLVYQFGDDVTITFMYHKNGLHSNQDKCKQKKKIFNIDGNEENDYTNSNCMISFKTCDFGRFYYINSHGQNILEGVYKYMETLYKKLR